jgi:putative oxidoreductase
MTGYSAPLAAFGRVLIAVIFLLSGLGKLGDPGGTIVHIAAHGLPVPPAAYAVALAVELPVSLALILGWQTRAMAVVMAVYSLAAALGFHTDFADQNQMINFLKNISMAGGMLQVAAFGGGAWSLDARRQLRPAVAV